MSIAARREGRLPQTQESRPPSLSHSRSQTIRAIDFVDMSLARQSVCAFEQPRRTEDRYRWVGPGISRRPGVMYA